VNRSWVRFVLPTLLLAGALGYCWHERSPSASANATASPPTIYSALLDGLTEGDVIGEWKVEKIFAQQAANQTPQVAINFERNGSGLTVWVARREVAPKPPIFTEKYAISFGHLRPFGQPIPPNAAEEMANKIAERVRRTENNVAVPTGL